MDGLGHMGRYMPMLLPITMLGPGPTENVRLSNFQLFVLVTFYYYFFWYSRKLSVYVCFNKGSKNLENLENDAY